MPDFSALFEPRASALAEEIGRLIITNDQRAASLAAKPDNILKTRIDAIAFVSAGVLAMASLSPNIDA